MNSKHFLISAALGLMLTACGDSQWTVKGTVNGAIEGDQLTLEASQNGRWYTLATTEINKEGRFSFKNDPAGFPDIYRLTYEGKTVYFPIDSIETVTLTADAPTFDTSATLTGSVYAEMLTEVDRKVVEAVSAKGAAAAVTDPDLKRELSGMLIGDPSGIVAYYIINKHVGGTPLFDPANPADLRIIGAVANAFNDQRPTDPRTRYLRELFLSYHRAGRIMVNPDAVTVAEKGSFDIQLYDRQGNLKSLHAIAQAAKVTVLNFTAYAADESPAFNLELNSAYTKYHDRGMEIYQVSMDGDEYLWREVAGNLPWVAVYNPATTDGTQNLINYNVRTLPTTYILDSEANVVERIDDIADLSKMVARHLK